MSSAALSRIKVVDLSRVRTGPTCVRQLADFGASVVKVEAPGSLAYASISGFGEDGPYRMRPSFEQIAQGMGGLMSVTGLPGQGPVRVGIPVASLCARLFAAQGG